MNKTFLEVIKIIFAVIVIFLSIIAIIMIIIKLLGHSPSELTILSIIITVLVTFQILIITILFQIKGDVGSLKEFKRQTVSKIKEIENKI